MTTALEFYHNSFGKIISNSEISNLLQIDVGEKCGTDFCYISLNDAKIKKSWPCIQIAGKEHETGKLLYWSYDKGQMKCPTNCTGLDEKCFKESPKDKHLARLALSIGVNMFPDFVIMLGLSRNDWEHFEYKHQRADVNMMKIDALCEWKKKMDHPIFADLKSAIINTCEDLHLLCQIFREDTSILDIDNPALHTVPDEDTLYDLSRKIGNCAILLGIELDLATPDIEETIIRYNKDMFDQNYDILRKWKTKCSKSSGTIRTLIHVLKIVDNRGCKFLKEKYKIDI